ncbi:TPA: hypothetical protein NQR86_003604 [Klebsiella pneumoniae]|uniref:hypothetical protein n=1 Tax=Klebsiella pneumoniae TaxID=573 RepID=UPI001E032874|nr:hypothetical protein AI2754V5_1311 [Klebsiella pneumoniae]CAH4128116.1 hypothetical protein AI2754V5_1311 [Klebsiella pneumoniae]HCJ2284228.1 hypothetical protein [Klebsiella pneumoniae]
MTSKLTSEILDDETLAELIDFRRSRIEYCQKEGLPYQKALHDSMMLALEELQERRKVERDTEPYGFTDGDRRGMIYKPEHSDRLSEPVPVYRHAQPAPVVRCPFHCGWDNLNKLAIQDAALVARGLVEGELTTEVHRQAAISNNDRLLKVISACRAAMLAAAPQEVK